MDVLVLIDKLDDVVHNARPVPLTDQVRVDREGQKDAMRFERKPAKKPAAAAGT